jgi:hypothetical protein
MDSRTIGHELQDQVLAAARKGRQRVTSTVRTVTATAQLIRPQLPSLPRPPHGLPTPAELRDSLFARLPTPDQIREKAKLPASDQIRERVAKLPTPDQIRERAPGLVAMLPTPDQIRSGAHEFAGQVRFVQRLVTDQVRAVAEPLMQQASSVLTPEASRTRAEPTPAPESAAVAAAEPEDTAQDGATAAQGHGQKPEAGESAARPAALADSAKAGPAKRTSTGGRRTPSGAAKPKTKPAGK